MSLFWRILIGFWLSMVLMTLGCVALLRVYDEAQQLHPMELATSKRAGFVIDTASRALAEGGVERFQQMNRALRRPGELLEPPLFVNASGQDILGRYVPAEALADAQKTLSKNKDKNLDEMGAPTEPVPPEPGDLGPGIGPAPDMVNGPRPDPGQFPGPAPSHAMGQIHGTMNVKSVVMPDGQQMTVFMLNYMLPPERHLLFGLLEAPLLMPLSALLVSLLFSAMLARYLVRPIQILRDGLHQVALGQFDTQIGLDMGKRSDEMGELGRDADSMATQLKQLMGSQKRLLHDISHDLRSPLARLQVAVGLTRQDPGRIDEMLNRMEHEADRLDNMLSEVLTLARLESGVPQPQEDYLDLVALLQSLVDDTQFANPDHPLALHLLVEGECLLPCRGELLWRAFDNLLRNAVQHTPAGSQISLQLEATASHYLIRLQDTGPGIPDELMQEVFEPFHHAGNTRGHGLGLAIAKRAIEAHGGRILAENALSGGLIVKVLLPRPSSPALPDAA